MAELDRSHLRASDSDRSAVADRLRHALDEGRLDVVEYDERLQATYAAATYGELDKVTADLPAAAPSTLPAAATEAKLARRAEWVEEWRSWAGGALVMMTIWGVTCLASGQLLFFWPMFPIGIWAAVVIAGFISGDDKPKDGKRARD